MILAGSVIAALAIVIVDGIIFYRVSNNTFVEFSNSSSKRPELINRPKLDRVLEMFGEKAERFEALLANPPVLVDPSR